MTWYDPDELKAQALGEQLQPEFDPPETEAEDPETDHEELIPFVSDYQAFKTEFDAKYIPPN